VWRFMMEPLTEADGRMASQAFLERSREEGSALEVGALEAGAVGEAVGHDDVLVEVVGARGAVTFHLVDHLADGEDGGRGGRGVGLRL